MVTGPGEDTGILSGRNGVGKSVRMGSAGVHRWRSTGKQAGVKALNAPLRTWPVSQRKPIQKVKLPLSIDKACRPGQLALSRCSKTCWLLGQNLLCVHQTLFLSLLGTWLEYLSLAPL